MDPLIIVGLSLLLLSNMVTVYFTFSTWYGSKKDSKGIPVYFDEDGKMHIMDQED